MEEEARGWSDAMRKKKRKKERKKETQDAMAGFEDGERGTWAKQCPGIGITCICLNNVGEQRQNEGWQSFFLEEKSRTEAQSLKHETYIGLLKIWCKVWNVSRICHSVK